MRYGLASSALILLAAGCAGDRAPVAYGDPNSIIVAAEEPLWAEVRDTVRRALEPRIYTVRSEKAFEVTHIPPGAPEWVHLRQFKQVLVIGEAEDAWVEEALTGRDGPLPEAPALLERDNVWVRNQRVTVLLLPSGGGAAAVESMLPELHDLLDRRFREYTLRRMYVSGVNEGLRERLISEAGFGLVVPEVYRWAARDSVYVFRNDYPSPDELLRTIVVTWREGTSQPLTAEAALAWRASLEGEYLDPPQEAQPGTVQSRRLPDVGAGAVEVQGIWHVASGNWPGAGPFLSRMVACPEQDRTYFLDASLYAPGKEKYEYMLQLHAILHSFECGTGPVRSAS